MFVLKIFWLISKEEMGKGGTETWRPAKKLLFLSKSEDSLAYFNVVFVDHARWEEYSVDFCHSLIMWPSASCSSLVFGVLICKLEKITVMTTHGCCED